MRLLLFVKIFTIENQTTRQELRADISARDHISALVRGYGMAQLTIKIVYPGEKNQTSVLFGEVSGSFLRILLQ
jgi:hypothetical protein